MRFIVLWTLIAVHGHVLSERPPAAPQNIRVDHWLLTWPAATEQEVTYTVQYSSFDSDVWTDVPACVHISLNRCNVISTKAEGELGCVLLRVQAERRGLTSTPVEACSRHGDSCTPDFSLTAGPGSLTVHLSRNHSLALEHGDHAKHRVYYGKEGEPRQQYEDVLASVTIRELLEGQRYCTEVQYVYFDVPVGLATCTRCEVIPKSRAFREGCFRVWRHHFPEWSQTSRKCRLVLDTQCGGCEDACARGSSLLWNDAGTMRFIVLWTLIAVHGHVLSERPPAAPQNIRVDHWLLTWPAATEQEVTYTVQYSSFDSDVWTDVPACVHISLNRCNVISTKAEGELGCVLLRVQAERRGLTSTPVEACSRHGDSCTPDFSLTAGPGSLTVHLSRNHSLALEHGDHAKHRVYYGKEGEPRQQYEDVLASVTIRELLEGQRYCTEVQYVYFDVPVGLATCTRCEVIPKSSKDSKQSGTTVAVVLVVGLLLLVPVLSYFLIFQRGTIKRWLSPYHIPEDFFEPFPKSLLPIASCSHTEEHCHVISSISPEELRPPPDRTGREDDLLP